MKTTPIPHSITSSSPSPSPIPTPVSSNNIFPPKPKPTTKLQPSQSKYPSPINNTNTSNPCININQQLHKFITDTQLCVASVCQSYDKLICDCNVGNFQDDADGDSFVRQLQAIQSLILVKNVQIKSLQHQISQFKNSYNSNISQSNSFSSTSSTRNPLINQLTSDIKNQISYVQKMLEKLREKKNMLRESKNVGDSIAGVYLEKCLKQGREAWSYQEFVRELRDLGGVKYQNLGRDMKKSIQVGKTLDNLKQKQKQKNTKDKLHPKNKDKLKNQQKPKNSTNVNENIIISSLNGYTNKTSRQISQHKLSDIYNKVHQIKDTRTNTNPTYTHPHPYNYNHTTSNSHTNTNHNTTPNSNINLNLNSPQPQIVLSPILSKIKTLQKKTTMLQTALKSTKKKHIQQLTNYHNKLQFLYDENKILDNKLSLKIKEMETAQKRLQQGITTTTTNNPHQTLTLTNNTNANTSINDYYNINPTYPYPPNTNTNTNISIDNRLPANPLRIRNSTRKLSNKQPNRSENMMIRASY